MNTSQFFRLLLCFLVVSSIAMPDAFAMTGARGCSPKRVVVLLVTGAVLAVNALSAQLQSFNTTCVTRPPSQITPVQAIKLSYSANGNKAQAGLFHIRDLLKRGCFPAAMVFDYLNGEDLNGADAFRQGCLLQTWAALVKYDSTYLPDALKVLQSDALKTSDSFVTEESHRLAAAMADEWLPDWAAEKDARDGLSALRDLQLLSEADQHRLNDLEHVSE